MAKQRSNIIAVLDIGTSKVVCFIAKIGSHGKIDILGIGHHVSQGIRAGLITDIKAFEKSVIHAVEAAEKMAEEPIQKVFVGISSNNLFSHRLSSEIAVTGHEITEKDLNKLMFQVLDKFNDQEVEVIHNFAYDYILDGNRGIESPLGMFGNKLSGEFHVISAQASILLNIANALSRCQLEVEGYISSSYAAGLATLTKDEMDLGVTLIEFGGGCSSISVFNKGHMVFTDGIPLGGINVSNDIARGLCTDFASAERVKNLYGSLILTSVEKQETIEIPISGEDDSEVNVIFKENLVEIIRARVEETMEIIKTKLEESGTANLGGNKIVLTGGSAQISGTKELVNHIYRKTVRVGYPKMLDGLADSTSGLSFATPIGMIINITETQFAEDQYALNVGNGFFTSFVSWLKQNFA